MRQFITNYFSISKKEWNGIAVLLLAILLVLAAPYLYQKLHKDKPINLKEFDKARAMLDAMEKRPTNTKYGKTTGPVFTYTANKLKPGEYVELNTADSAALTRVHGIGPSFARRIIAYRKKLGGFVNKSQLKEVYGLDNEKYTEIADELKVDAYRVKLLNINNLEFEQIRKLPYLNYKQANAVTQYRLQHGNYTSIKDMGDIAILDEDILRKIAPYITFK